MLHKRERSFDEIRAMKLAFYADLESGTLTLGQATRRMRKIVGVTQAVYATKVLKIFPRVLMDLENDRGNPTLETLQKVAKPFGLKVGFVRPAQPKQPSQHPPEDDHLPAP